MSTSWLLHIHVTCQTSLLGRSTWAPKPQLATLLCEVITLILSTGQRPVGQSWNAPKLGLYQVIWESKKLGNARRFTHSGELKPPKPLSNDPGFTLLRRIPSRFLEEIRRSTESPWHSAQFAQQPLKTSEIRGAPVDFLWSFCSNNWLGAYPPPRIIILYMVENTKYCEITNQKTVDRSR